MRNGIVRLCAAILCAAFLFASGGPVFAQANAATITGLVIDHRTALPVSGATVKVKQGDVEVSSTSTDGSGHYTISGINPGIYAITIAANGYAPSANNGTVVLAGSNVLNAGLSLTSNSRSDTDVIGRVSGNSNSLSAATTISQQINAQSITQVGEIRVADALKTLPATNMSTSSSVGDDVSINLRGFGSSETAALLDGHPVGPMGVGGGSFNFALGPAFGLTSVDVTYGSGAQGLYGNDTIGGAVNMITISPTATPHFSFQQQVGGFGLTSTGITATGTVGKLGYAFAAGRLGEYGDFFPFQNPQSARPNNVSQNSVTPPGICSGNTDADQNLGLTDVSQCNLNDNTYSFSQNTYQAMLLGKLTYALSPATNIFATAYNGVQWSDSTGNGDNDNIPFSTRLATIQGAAPNCTTGGGSAGYSVISDPTTAVPTQSCLTAQQYAAVTSGPDGGGAGRQRATNLRDYSFGGTTTAGIHNITLSGFIDSYQYWKDSSLSLGLDANGGALGGAFADYNNTIGFVASDEFMLGRNDIGFGFSTWHQLATGTRVDFSSGASPDVPTAYFGEWSYFARDTYTISKQISFFLNAWMKHSSVSEKTTFDPRATLQFRPTKNDVVQFTYGRSDGAPSPSLKNQGPVIAEAPGPSLTSVSCSGFNDVASAGNPNLLPESANDFEVGIGHKFSGDSNIQVNAYVTKVTNQLFGASQPLLAFGIGNVTFQPDALNQYLTRLQSQCPGQNITMASLPQYLSIGTTFNASQALARGLEFSGRQRIAKIAYIDYGYYIESSTQVGIDDNILVNNPTVVNGAQLPGIPLHTANIALDVAPGPWEFRIEDHYIGNNNPLSRPAYWYTNAFLSHSFGKNTLLTLGGTNIFNNAVSYYGYIGLGTTPMVNPVAALAGMTANPSEEFGIAPATLTLTFQQKI
jgi:outer membrane receptor protein involved in Fe transport